MMITHKHLSRRTFLKGTGTVIALPFLDAMLPAFTKSSAAKPPMRMAFVYVPNGIVMQDWTPSQEGTDFKLPRILAPMEAHRQQMLLLSGLTLNGGRALGDGPGDHARAAASFLTGAHPKKTAGLDINNGISVDQVAALQIGNLTKFASLELGCEDGKLVGSCDSGYSCAYSNSLSWRSATTPNPPEINPRQVFERLFGANTETAAQRAKRERYNKSILDFVREDTTKLKGSLGATDRRKLDEYLSAVREIEQRIAKAEDTNKQIEPTIAKPTGIPVEFAQHMALMYDLLTLALQTDQTRVVTLMIGREGSNRTYREIGVADGHHGITHHQNKADLVEKVTQINCYHLQHFSAFIDRIKAVKEGDGLLLDRTMILYGSGLSDGNRHQHHDIPTLIVGGGMKNLGQHIRYPKETPMTNLYLAMLERMGVKADALGDSKGTLDVLA